MFTNEPNIGLPLQACGKKTAHGVETHWPSAKKKKEKKKTVPDAAVRKKGCTHRLVWHEKTHYYWFP